jgi:cell wall-associated NlpC family hydrolase
MKLNKQNRFIILSIICLLSLSTMAQFAKPTTVPLTSTPPPSKPTVYAIIEQVRKKHAPDKRVALFYAELDSNRIVGKTNLPAAKKDLLNRLKSNGYTLLDAVKLLPDNDLLENSNCGIANISVLNLRSQPKESAELASQALLGTPLKVLDRERNWYMIQTPDNYIGWADGSTFARITQYQFDRYQGNKFLMFAKPYGFSYAKADENSQTISDLTWGNVLAVKDTLQDFYEVIYPDGRNAFILKKEVTGHQEWKQSVTASEQNLVNAAFKMQGLPYLWGGTSWKGVDCSGFTRMIYQSNGILLPRDASQQVWSGVEVAFDSLQIGDLLFFGEKATTEKSERVVHVGMWLGNKEFIHSSGMVKISSFDECMPRYDAHNAGRYLRARRILGTDKGIVSLKK